MLGVVGEPKKELAKFNDTYVSLQEDQGLLLESFLFDFLPRKTRKTNPMAASPYFIRKGYSAGSYSWDSTAFSGQVQPCEEGSHSLYLGYKDKEGGKMPLGILSLDLIDINSNSPRVSIAQLQGLNRKLFTSNECELALARIREFPRWREALVKYTINESRAAGFTSIEIVGGHNNDSLKETYNKIYDGLEERTFDEFLEMSDFELESLLVCQIAHRKNTSFDWSSIHLTPERAKKGYEHIAKRMGFNFNDETKNYELLF